MRDQFISAMTAEPDNNALRLVFADWLEDRGDPLAEFIRLQIELEPLRIPCSDLMAELERNKRLHRIPPGKDESDKTWSVALQLQREEDLIRLHRKDWLGETADLVGRNGTLFEPEFRRGFVTSAEIGLSALLTHGKSLRRCCPFLQHLIVFGSLGRGEELASCAALAGIPHLTLAGWLNASDAVALCNSPHLIKTRSLTFYLGNRGGSECLIVSQLPSLTELTLVQVWGGIGAEDRVELDGLADSIVWVVQQSRSGLSVHHYRPFNHRFPLDGANIGSGLYAGTLPGGQAVLVAAWRNFDVLFFDDEGNFVREERLDQDGKMPSGYQRFDWRWHKWEVMKVLQPLLGFKPGPIFVREFQSSPEAEVGVECWGLFLEELTAPETIDPKKAEETGASIYGWWSTHEFELPNRNHYWVGSIGRITSS